MAYDAQPPAKPEDALEARRAYLAARWNPLYHGGYRSEEDRRDFEEIERRAIEEDELWAWKMARDATRGR